MDLLKKCVAEAIGTAVLVLVACGVAVVIRNDYQDIAIPITFGLVIVAMSYCIGNISGCHINPAVSFAMAINKKMSWKECGFYVIAQVIGAFVGALLLGVFLRGDFTYLCGNEINYILYDSGRDFWFYAIAFLIEIILTFIFVITVLGATDKRYHDGKNAGLAIGGSLALVHFIGIHFTGTSVNPARSLAPAVLEAIAGNTESLSQVWIWILAPLAGAALAAITYKFLTSKKEEKKEEPKEDKVEEVAN